MAVEVDITILLERILTAVYGKDVRQSIHDAIQKCYEDGVVGATDLIARQAASEALELATDAAKNATNALATAQAAQNTGTNAATAASNAQSTADTANNVANTAKDSIASHTSASNPHGITMGTIGLSISGSGSTLNINTN